MLRTLSLVDYLDPSTVSLARVRDSFAILSTHRVPQCHTHTVITGALPLTLCTSSCTGCKTLVVVGLPISPTYRAVHFWADTPRDSCGGVHWTGATQNTHSIYIVPSPPLFSTHHDHLRVY